MRSVWSRTRAPLTASIAATICSPCSGPAVSTVMSRSVWPESSATRSIDADRPAGLPDRAGDLAQHPGRVLDLHADREGVLGGGNHRHRGAIYYPPGARPARRHGLSDGLRASIGRDAGALPGAPICVDDAITGSFAAAEQGAYVYVPFDVPRGTTAVRVKYCHDQPERGLGSRRAPHTLDLGSGTRGRRTGAWGAEQFRGWGGSSHPDVTVTRAGVLDRGGVPARAARSTCPAGPRAAFLPGPIPPGRWAAELGVAAVVRSRGRRRRRGALARRDRAVERPGVRRRSVSRRRGTTPRPRTRAPAGTRATSTSTPSTRRSATRRWRETFDYAFRPLARRTARASTSSRSPTT